MAILTNRTYLMKGTGTGTLTYSKLVDITEFPNLGGEPENIDVTTLSDMERHYINGIDEQEKMTFSCLYNKTDYSTLAALEGQTSHFAVWMGGTDASTPTGDKGKWSFDGQLSVFVNGGTVNEAVTMTVTISPSSAIVFA